MKCLAKISKAAVSNSNPTSTLGMFGTAVVDRAVRYRNREGRAAVQETRGAVHFCDSSAVCGGNNHRDRRLFGVIIGFFSPPPQDTQSQTRPLMCRFSFGEWSEKEFSI